jgi:hypothetical protein
MGGILPVLLLFLSHFLGCLLFELIKCFHIARYLAAKIGTNSAVLI